MKSDGLICDIRRFSTEDGPGIRTTVFFKGCPLRCLWCHSPESINSHPELAFYENICMHCGRCCEVCPQDAQELIDGQRIIHWQRCDNCGECARVCPSRALRMIGTRMTPSEIAGEVEKDRTFYKNSEGGVTLSGGEPAYQLDFIASLLKICKTKGISTALDTSGFVTWQELEKIADLVDLFLYDIKHMDEQNHIKFTGVSNRQILQNLRELVKLNKQIIIRIPLIPGYTISDQNIQMTKEFLKSLGIPKIDLLPFNGAAGSKYQSLGRQYPLQDIDPCTEEEEKQIFAEFREAGFDVRLKNN